MYFITGKNSAYYSSILIIIIYNICYNHFNDFFHKKWSVQLVWATLPWSVLNKIKHPPVAAKYRQLSTEPPGAYYTAPLIPLGQCINRWNSSGMSSSVDHYCQFARFMVSPLCALVCSALLLEETGSTLFTAGFLAVCCGSPSRLFWLCMVQLLIWSTAILTI